MCKKEEEVTVLLCSEQEEENKSESNLFDYREEEIPDCECIYG